MHRILIALLLTTLVACEEEKPPIRTKAPEAAPVPSRPAEQKPAKPAEEKAAAPASAAPASAAPAAAVPKVLLDPSLPEWSQKAPNEFKAKFTTSRGDITIL